MVAPSRNVTVPPGEPEAVEETVAVNVTGWPNVVAPGDAARVVVVGAAGLPSGVSVTPLAV